MKKGKGMLSYLIALSIAGAALLAAGCSDGGGGAATSAGKTSLAVSDAPVLAYEHVWITVKEAWFHKLDIDNLADPGWIKFPLATPMTIDLAGLTAGNTQDVWSGLALPAGTYRQIRVFLASTESAPLPSLPSGVVFNNEVDFRDGTGAHKAPLRIPSPGEGIKVIPETPIVVNEGTPVKLALDFNADQDVIPIFRQGQLSSARNSATATQEFLLKARLKYFDLNNAAAVTGTLAPPSGTFANYTGKQFVVQAEQQNATGDFRVVRRSATIDSNGKYTLYPLPLFGSATTAKYDLVIRGRNVDTFVITGVKAHKGSTPQNAPAVSSTPTTMVTDTNQYGVQVNVKPTGAIVTFYQTLPGDPVPYEIVFQNIDPFSAKGTFPLPVQLSAGPLHVGAWNNGGPVTFATVTPVEGVGNFRAAASAFFFDRSPYQNVSSLTPLLLFAPLSISSPGVPRTVTGTITVNDPGLDTGIMLITRGGIVVDSIDVSSQMAVGTKAYTAGNLPGGTTATPLTGAFYDLFVLGWNAAQPQNNKDVGIATGVNLQTSDGTANVTMQKF